MRVPLALLVLALLELLRNSGSGGEQPPAVPSPTKPLVTSENFKTIFNWQYPPMSETPRFTVEIKPYNLGTYKNVSTCVNISAHFCDVSREISHPLDSYWLRVKALLGSQQSEYVESKEFILQRHGKIGPPKLKLSRHSDKIVVDIYHPPFPSVELLPRTEEINLDPMYSVTFWNSKNETKELFPEDNCTVYKCTLEIPVPAEDSSYCVRARGEFYGNLMIGAPSEKSCIDVSFKQKFSMQHIIIPCAVILSLSLILSVFCGCKKIRKRNITLPKSLVSVIRNLNTDSILDSKSEAKYIYVVDVLPSPSGLPENDEVISLEGEPKEETVSPENSTEGSSSVPSPEAPVKAEKVPVQESTEEVSCDDEHSHKVKESYFVSDSSQSEMCTNSSDPEVSAAEIQQLVIPSSCLQFSGYDKPHVPLDTFIDVGEEQPVIAYRPTE
ncbi:interferon gamma receptor 1 [Calypte anna]|uniref:interferon gamma receptor 1 n=1 Tax=Calypte anna TaxID=9244 RepID=UPI0011C3AF56|nr:interferon gamma receptor 1 [Calypte anna]